VEEKELQCNAWVVVQKGERPGVNTARSISSETLLVEVD
jgi:hypothetical protein